MARVLSLPMVIAPNGSMATITQDHPAEITQSVALLLDTRPGDRRTLPDYGLPDHLFDGYDPTLVDETIAEWEPRANPELVATVADGASQQIAVHLREGA